MKEEKKAIEAIAKKELEEKKENEKRRKRRGRWLTKTKTIPIK